MLKFQNFKSSSPTEKDYFEGKQKKKENIILCPK